VALFLVNSSDKGNYHHILRSALSVDFPFFEPRCELSPLTFCEHPHTPCKKSKLSLIGYAKYIDGAHKFQPLPLEPEPIFAFVCQGCGVQKGHCKEECSLYAEEIIGYKVFTWDLQQRDFRITQVKKEDYDTLKHGYFSYKVWKRELDEIRRERSLRRNKRTREESYEFPERQPKRKKTRTESPSCRPSPHTHCSPSPQRL
jgi:hypothetical protein